MLAPLRAVQGFAAAAVVLARPALAHADEGGFLFLKSEEVRSLFVYFAQTLISWGVPALVLVLLIGVSFGGGKRGDDEDELPPPLAKFLGMSKEPKEFLSISQLSSKLDSFDYSLEKASVSKEAALRTNLRRRFERTLGKELASLNLTTKQIEQIEKASLRFAKIDGALKKQLESKKRALRALYLAQGGQVADFAMAEASNPVLANPEEEGAVVEAAAANATVSSDASGSEANSSSTAEEAKSGGKSAGGPMEMMKGMQSGFALNKLNGQIAKLQAKRQSLEATFFSGLASVLKEEEAKALAEAIKAADAGGGSESVLEVLRSLHSTPLGKPAGKLFVLKFFGDVTASQVGDLRQEVTAVLRNADASKGDQVLLVLNTGGGTVTGYGLAAAQLVRIKEAGLRLTISVEQVAASGGYMMACVADHLTAAPFAVLGSIGVITEQPNVYERLTKEGIKFTTITAGKFKRTLTPTKKIDLADVEKQKKDIEQVLNLFKGFVSKNRPSLDIEKVATGETWFGPDALAEGLVDELVTSDDMILRHAKEGAEVLAVSFKKQTSPFAALSGDENPAAQLAAGGGLRGLLMAVLARNLLSDPRKSVIGEYAEDVFPSRSSQRTYDDIKLARPAGQAEPEIRVAGGYDGGATGADDDDYDKSWGWW